MSISPYRLVAARAAVVALAFTVAPAFTAGLRAQDPDAHAGHEDEAGRDAWFWAQRSFPGTERPYAAMGRARAAATQRFAHAAGASTAAAVFGGGWRPLGPFGLFNAETGYFDSSPQLDAGRVTAVAPNPVAGGPLFIGSASGGVWRAGALGIGWIPLTDDQCALTTGAVAIDPVDPSIIYAGTGEFNAPSEACGMLRSTDGGATWASIGGAAFTGVIYPAADFGQILVDRATAGSATSTVVIASTNAGVYRSANSGNTWQRTLGGPAASVVADPAQPGVYFASYTASALSQRGVYRSSDDAATWQMLPALPQTTPDSIGRIELAASAAAPNRIYALVGAQYTSRLLGLWVWDDSAAAWQRLAASGVNTGDPRGDFGGQTSYDLAIAVDPRDANRVYVAGVRAYVSTDGGRTFAPMGMEIHCDWHRIVVDPNDPDILYAATDGGIFISTDAGETWTSRNAGLSIAQFYAGASISPQGTMVLAGSQDNSTSLYSGTLTWTGQFATGDGGYTAINYVDPTIQWASGYWSSSGPDIVRRSATSVQARNAGIVTTDRGVFMPPLVMDPVNPSKLYFGTQRLYRTTTDGASWSPVTSDLTAGSGALTTIAVAPSDTQTIYVGASDGTAQVSRDGGATFTSISAGLPSRYITRIVVDPDTATRAIATVSGYGTGHVFETRNAGATWTDISGTLVDAPVNGVVIVPNTGVVLVASDVGVYQTANDGATWQAGPTGMPNVIVQDLAYSPTSHLLVAGTYGRGMFAYTVGGQTAMLRGDVNADGKIDAFDALLLEQALVSTLPPATVVYPAGDANCNGAIESADIELVLRAAVGLPTGTACVGTVR